VCCPNVRSTRRDSRCLNGFDTKLDADRGHLHGMQLCQGIANTDSKWYIGRQSSHGRSGSPDAVCATLESMAARCWRGRLLAADSQANGRLARLSEHMPGSAGRRLSCKRPSRCPTGTGIRSLFDRAGKYEELIKARRGATRRFPISEPSAIARFSTSSDVNSKYPRAGFLWFAGKEQAAQVLRDTEGR